MSDFEALQVAIKGSTVHCCVASRIYSSGPNNLSTCAYIFITNIDQLMPALYAGIITYSDYIYLISVQYGSFQQCMPHAKEYVPVH